MERVRREARYKLWIVSISRGRISGIIVPFTDTYRQIFAQGCSYHGMYTLCHLAVAIRFAQTRAFAIVVAGIPVKTDGIRKDTRCLDTGQKCLHESVIPLIIVGNRTDKFGRRIDLSELRDHAIPLLQVVLNRDAVQVWLIPKLVELAARTEIADKMFIERDIGDIGDNPQAMRATIFNCLNTFFDITITCFIRKETTNQCKASRS